MDSNRIISLSLPDNVRRHTEVFFCDSDYTETETAFLQMIGIFSEEAADGHSIEINVKFNRDSSIEIQSENRGLFLGSAVQGDKAEWTKAFCDMFPDEDRAQGYEFIFGDLYAKKSYFASHKEKYNGMHLHHFSRYQSTLCQNQCVCEYMDVVAVRGGYERRLHFEKGYNIGGLIEKASDAKAFTYIHFKYDKEVFGENEISYNFAKEQLKRLSVLNGGVRFNLAYETEKELCQDSFFHRNGVREYLEELLNGQEHTDIFEGACAYTGKDREELDEYSAKLRILFAFCRNKACIETFHNYKLLSLNGDHTDEVVKLVHKGFDFTHCDSELTENEIKEHLVLLVVTNTTRGYSRWNEEGQRSLGDEMLVDMVNMAMDERLMRRISCRELADTVSGWICKEREKNTV